jgi:hypothetical protein
MQAEKLRQQALWEEEKLRAAADLHKEQKEAKKKAFEEAILRDGREMEKARQAQEDVKAQERREHELKMQKEKYEREMQKMEEERLENERQLLEQARKRRAD